MNECSLFPPFSGESQKQSSNTITFTNMKQRYNKGKDTSTYTTGTENNLHALTVHSQCKYVESTQ